MVVGIVITLAVIIDVIYVAKKRYRRRVTIPSAPITSATFTEPVNRVALNDDVRPMRLQFPPPSVSTVQRDSVFSMTVECGAYQPPHRGMTVVEAPPPYPSS